MSGRIATTSPEPGLDELHHVGERRGGEPALDDLEPLERGQEHPPVPEAREDLLQPRRQLGEVRRVVGEEVAQAGREREVEQHRRADSTAKHAALGAKGTRASPRPLPPAAAAARQWWYGSVGGARRGGRRGRRGSPASRRTVVP